MVSELQGAIIAAGRGERLRAGGEVLPKPLVEIAGRSLLGRQADQVIAAGASRVVAVVNSETARIIELRKLELSGRLALVVRDTPNSMETLFALREYLAPGHFLMATVDAVMPSGELAAFALRAQASVGPGAAFDGALGVVRWRGDERPLFVSATAEGLVTSLGGAESALVTAGAYFLSTRVFDLIESARRSRLGAFREFLALLVRSGMRLAAIELAAAIDIDQAADLEAARAMLGVAPA